MSTASFILLIFTAITLVGNHAFSQPPTKPTFQYVLCHFESGNYSPDTPYYTNLITVFTTLQTQAYSSAEFYNTSSGYDANDTVHGQYYCRGDIDSQLCGDCIQEAAHEALNTCALAKGGIVWYEECTLRYSSESMYGVLDQVEHPYSIAYSSTNVESDQEEFAVALNDTLNGLIEEAIHGSYNNLFTLGEGRVYGNDLTVYGLVQCSPDLNGAQCETCLRSIFGDVWTCCGEWPVLVYAMYPSCEMMYNAEGVFYYSTPSTPASPPPLVSSPPAPSPEVTGTQPPPPSKAAPPPLKSSQPPPPLLAPPPPLMNSPPPLTNSQPPPPPSTFSAPYPLTSSQPPPPPYTVSDQPSPVPPSNGGPEALRIDRMKLGTITAGLVILMLVFNP